MFKLVTWNIQSGRSPDGKTELDRIIACLDRFCSFDMLCVQEVSSGYKHPLEIYGLFVHHYQCQWIRICRTK